MSTKRSVRVFFGRKKTAESPRVGNGVIGRSVTVYSPGTIAVRETTAAESTISSKGLTSSVTCNELDREPASLRFGFRVGYGTFEDNPQNLVYEGRNRTACIMHRFTQNNVYVLGCLSPAFAAE